MTTGIVAKFHKPWVDWINKTFYEGLPPFTIEDITQYRVENCVRPDIQRAVYGFLNTPGLYTTLEPHDGALECLERLQRMGFDLMVVTAPARDPDTAADKLRWVKKYMPWLHRDNVCLWPRKWQIKADFIIDDSPVVLENYLAAWPYARLITIDWPFNRQARTHLRAQSYRDTNTAWSQIYNYLTDGRTP